MITRNETYVFNPHQTESQDFIPALVNNIQNGEITDIVGDVPKYEHIVLETALHIACNSLTQRMKFLIPSIETSLKALKAESLGIEILQKTQVSVCVSACWAE